MMQSQNQQFADLKALWDQLDWEGDSHREEARLQRLQQRARQYASLPPQEDDETLRKFVVLVFQLSTEQFSVDVTTVRKVLTVDKIWPVPGTPDFYPGVMNVRGQIITVIDLRVFFNMTVDPADTLDELIVVEARNLQIGILTRHVLDVVSIPATDIEPMDDVRYARGVTAERLVLLDIERMFEDERLIIGGLDE